MVRAGPRVSAGSGRAETGSSRQGQGLARLGNGACSAEGGATVAAPGTEAGCKCRLDVQAGHVEQSSASRKDRLRRGWSYSIPAGLEKTLESPWDCKEIQPVHPKGDQSWVFIGRTDAEAETAILWPPHAKS